MYSASLYVAPVESFANTAEKNTDGGTSRSGEVMHARKRRILPMGSGNAIVRVNNFLEFQGGNCFLK